MESHSLGSQLAARVRTQLPLLKDAEARVAQVLLDQGRDLVTLSVSDVATLAHTASSTVVRACQRLGFRGFQEVKILAAAGAPPPVPVGGPQADALTRTVHTARETLDGLTTTVSQTQMDDVARVLSLAPHTLVVGAGLSSAVCLDAAYRLRALGMTVDAPCDPITAELAAGLLPPSAACLAVSHTGATRSTVAAAERARTAGATVIALTSYAHTPLTEASTHTLLAGGQDLILGLEAVASRLAHLAVIDALTLTLLETQGPRARAALRLSAEVTAAHAY
ncbi:MurR/RpiR family transcriptional regulator [Streptomyces sp. NBC_01497]|uniref:MurR/RpiR family transcriptional regulator n=1 Tax=Streptomyces sp. NBC_01497 TaxID=2903885 RepID=UPI002E37A4A6|nr:MurR/RpiR family transcriptional regulator [Streptomyces sp. NBC_01497]